MKLALIGGGLTGATLARELSGSGIDLHWFEKSRGLGGQCSTRRSPNGRFDHGAPYFHAHSDLFQNTVRKWVEQGVAAPWNARCAEFKNKSLHTIATNQTRYVGIPGMNELCKFQAGEELCLFGERVSQIGWADEQWLLDFEGEREQTRADALVLTTPPAQASDLLGSFHYYQSYLKTISTDSTWVVLLTLSEPLNAGFDEILFSEGPLKKAVRNAGKPNRGGEENWVLYGRAAWSKENLERPAEDASKDLVDVFREALGDDLPKNMDWTGHRWRYAQAPEVNDLAPLIVSDSRLFVTGSYFYGSTLEGAWRAGREAADVVKKWYADRLSRT